MYTNYLFLLKGGGYNYQTIKQRKQKEQEQLWDVKRLDWMRRTSNK